MSGSDSDSAGSAAHASKARKGPDGHVAKIREQFEPSTSQALALVPTRRSARVQAASQTGKRNRSPAEPADSPAPAPSPAASPTITLAALLARIETLEGETQHLRADLQQTKADLAATRSELAVSKTSLDQRLEEQTSHSIARETAVKDGLQGLLSAEGSSLEHLSQRVRANNIVMHGVPDTAANSRPADLTRFVGGKLDAASPRRGPSMPRLRQSVQAVSHIGRPGSNNRAVLVEFSTHTAKHEAFKLSSQLRREGLHLADELTPKQRKAQKGLAADFSALKLRGFNPFYRRGRLMCRDHGVNRTCKRGEAIRVSAPPGPLGLLLGPLALLQGLGPLLLLVEASTDKRPGILAKAPWVAGDLAMAEGFHTRVPPLLMLLRLLPMLLTLLLLLPWLVMGLLLWPALEPRPHQAPTCHPP